MRGVLNDEALDALVDKAKAEGVSNTDYLTEPAAVLTKREQLLKEKAVAQLGD